MSQRSPRKKWRLKLYPSFTYAPMGSQKQVYELAIALRDQYAQNLTPIHQVDIEVNEGDGWRLFERAEFPARDDAEVSR